MQKLDSDALMYQFVHRFDHIPDELRLLTPDMECQRILHRFYNKDTDRWVEDRCHKVLEDDPGVQEILAAHGFNTTTQRLTR